MPPATVPKQLTKLAGDAVADEDVFLSRRRIAHAQSLVERLLSAGLDLGRARELADHRPVGQHIDRAVASLDEAIKEVRDEIYPHVRAAPRSSRARRAHDETEETG